MELLQVELTDDRNDNNFLNKNVINSESFKYKTSVTGSTCNDDEKINDGKKEVEIAVPLKYQ